MCWPPGSGSDIFNILQNQDLIAACFKIVSHPSYTQITQSHVPWLPTCDSSSYHTQAGTERLFPDYLQHSTPNNLLIIQTDPDFIFFALHLLILVHLEKKTMNVQMQFVDFHSNHYPQAFSKKKKKTGSSGLHHPYIQLAAWVQHKLNQNWARYTASSSSKMSGVSYSWKKKLYFLLQVKYKLLNITKSPDKWP